MIMGTSTPQSHLKMSPLPTAIFLSSSQLPENEVIHNRKTSFQPLLCDVALPLQRARVSADVIADVSNYNLLLLAILHQIHQPSQKQLSAVPLLRDSCRLHCRRQLSLPPPTSLLLPGQQTLSFIRRTL